MVLHPCRSIKQNKKTWCIWPPEGSRVTCFTVPLSMVLNVVHVSVFHHDEQPSSHYSVFWTLGHHCQHLQLPKERHLIVESQILTPWVINSDRTRNPKHHDLMTWQRGIKSATFLQVVIFCCFKHVCQWEEIQNVIIFFQFDLTQENITCLETAQKKIDGGEKKES